MQYMLAKMLLATKRLMLSSTKLHDFPTLSSGVSLSVSSVDVHEAEIESPKSAAADDVVLTAEYEEHLRTNWVHLLESFGMTEANTHHTGGLTAFSVACDMLPIILRKRGAMTVPEGDALRLFFQHKGELNTQSVPALDPASDLLDA